MIQDELGDTAGKAPQAGDIVAQHEPSDIEQLKTVNCSAQVGYTTPPTFHFMKAYVWLPLFAVPDRLKEFPVYRAFMVATALILLVLTGYNGARSSK